MSWPNNLDRPALGMRIPRLIMRGFYNWRYFRGVTPWDTHITPPEVVQLVEQENFPPGREHYAESIRRWTHGGSTFMNYAFFPFHALGRAMGISRAEMERLFAEYFYMTFYADDGKSAWYRWVKK